MKREDVYNLLEKEGLLCDRLKEKIMQKESKNKSSRGTDKRKRHKRKDRIKR